MPTDVAFVIFSPDSGDLTLDLPPLPLTNTPLALLLAGVRDETPPAAELPVSIVLLKTPVPGRVLELLNVPDSLMFVGSLSLAIVVADSWFSSPICVKFWPN